MISKKEFQEWLETVPEGKNLAIGEDGLTITLIGEDGREEDHGYIHVGLSPYEQSSLDGYDED